MPPALQAVLTSSGVNIGLAVIYPAFDAVRPLALVESEDRCPITVSSFGARTKPRVWPIPVALFRHQIIITLAIPLAAAVGSSGSGDPLLVSLAAAQHGPGDARRLVGHG